MSRTVVLLAALLLAVSAAAARGVRRAPAAAGTAAASARWADWVEPDFPFFSSVVDARAAGLGHADNLSPRALVLNLGHGCWAAFDTDLLRVAAIWNGRGLSANALAPGSYLRPDKKTPGGQTPAPEPLGSVWVANGIYPGWQLGERPVLLRSTRAGADRRGSGARSDSGDAWAGSRRSGCCREASASSTRSVGRRSPSRSPRALPQPATDRLHGHASFQDCRVRRAAGRRARQQGRRYRHRPVAGYRAGGRRHARAVLG